VVSDWQLTVGHKAQLPIRLEVSPLTEALASVAVDDLHSTYVSVPLSAVAAVSVLAAGLLAPDADFQPVVELLAFVARAFARGSGVAVPVAVANFAAPAGVSAPTPHHGCSLLADRCGLGKYCLAGFRLDSWQAVSYSVVRRAAGHRERPTEAEASVETGVPAEPAGWRPIEDLGQVC
jgi:hypothetical protein